jgi:hypothetical protein
MGFRLSRYILQSLHFGFALALPFALLLLFGCKQSHEEHADLGPEVDSSQLDAVLSKVVAGAHFEDLQAGQMVHYEESLRINNTDPNILEGTNNLYVVARTSDKDTKATRITIHRSLIERTTAGDSFQDIETESTDEFPTPELQSQGLLLNLGSNFKAATTAISDDPPPVRITYHNLRTSEGFVEPSDKVKKRSNCGNLHDCLIAVTYLSYDEVRWSDDTHYLKQSYDFQLTSSVPFMNKGLFGIMVSGCVGFSHMQDGKNYYIRDCQALTDLQM